MKHLLYPHDQDTTEDVANALGRLLRNAKRSTKVSLEKCLFAMLESRKVGTLRIEAQALDMLEDSKGGKKFSRKKMKGKKIKYIIENRDPEKVTDILKLKVKYCLEEEKKAQREYRHLKSRLKEIFLDRGKIKQFKKMIRKVAKDVQKRWTEGNEKIQKKVKWLGSKFSSKEDKGEAQAWAEKVAEGSGKNRKG